eukprot:SRR837773.3979.p3 GENE.SRR837773.3979~~SRR837773.3979.p3  ORF type:complete len:165 (-),score=16.47 SRR837773.3979:123-569(-)
MGRSRSRSRSRGGGGGDRQRIQDLVDDRQQARRDRDFGKADDLRNQLRDLGVNVDDTALTWRGPGGLEGNVYNGGQPGMQRKDGDWDCPRCGKMVFASKQECFSCGEMKPRDTGRGRSRRDDSRGRDRDRRRRRRDASDSRSPPRRRR